MQPDNPPPTSGESASGATVFGLDNVRLELPIAGIGSRILAASIDHLLLLFLQIVWFFGGLVLAGMAGLGGWGFGILVLGILFLQWGYFALFEIFMDGQTPGKLGVGLRVVSAHGGRATATAFIVRNFLRTFDLFVGLPIMAVDRRARRLGDAVAGTLVVHDREGPEEVQIGRHPSSWGSREVAVVESFLRRASRMEPERAQKLGDQLLRWIRRQEPAFWSENVGDADPSATAGDRVAWLRKALGAG
ncbi:MAG: RDD family protein [Thermoanaerobaculia bacterium]